MIGAALPARARFVLTGPSGWIGQAMLAGLSGRLGSPLAEQVTLFASSARELRAPSGEVLAVRPLSEISPADTEGAHVVHLAYLTKEKAQELGERRFTETNLAIDDAVLDAIASGPPRSLFVASSGAAQLAATGRDLHPYGLAKLRQEARFLEAAGNAGFPAIAGRIFNIAGPYINKLSSYAISNFVEQARDTGRIRIDARVPVFRSFLHVADLSALIYVAAIQGIARDRPIDLCGSEVVEMVDLASEVADAWGGQISTVRESVDFARPSLYLGSFAETRVLAMEAGLPMAPLVKQIGDTVAWIRNTYG